MIPAENVPLEYNQSEEPPHELQIQNFSQLNIQQLTAKKLSFDALALKYDNDGQFLAVGGKNGTKLLYSSAQQKFVAKVDDPKDNSITSIRWKPNGQGKSKVLVTGDAGGHLTFYHIPTLKPLFTVQQHDNSIHTVDFSPLGDKIATGGKDFHIRVYDQDTKSVTVDLKPAGWNNSGHDNRVFAVKFIDQNTLISGGWDSVVHLWDLRTGQSARHFYGTNISGESLDYENGAILAGCYTPSKQIQIWDFKTFHKQQEIDWTQGNIDEAEYVYTASYSRRDPRYFGVGSTGPNSQVRLYRQGASQWNHKLSAKIKGLQQGCFSLDFSSKLDQFAFTTPHHGLYIFSCGKAK